MKLSALMRLLDTLLGLIEREIEGPPQPSRGDLIRLGRRLRRANRLAVRLKKWES